MTATAAVEAVWRAHTAAPSDYTHYADNFSCLYVPTGCGTRSLADFRAFRARMLDRAEAGGLVRTRRVVSTHVTATSVVEERVVTVTLDQGREPDVALFLPGIKLLDPGATRSATVVMVLIAQVDADAHKLTSMRVHWDQGGLLRQLGLVQAASVPTVYGMHPNYQLPLLGIDQDKVLSPDYAHLNHLPSRMQPAPALPTPKENASAESLSTVLSGSYHGPSAPPKLHVRLVHGVSDTQNKSKIFEDVELPSNAFSGMPINRAKYKSNVVFGTADNSGVSTPAMQTRTRTPSESGSASPYNGGSPTSAAAAAAAKRLAGVHGTLFDPVTGDAPIPKVRDPERHKTHIDFSGWDPETGEPVLSDPSSPLDNKKRANVKHLETTLKLDDTVSASEAVLAQPPIKKKPNPALQSHFQNGQFTPPVEDESDAGRRYSNASVTLPPHLVSHIDEPVQPPAAKMNPQFESHIGDPEAEVKWTPKPKLKPDFDTTLDKPEAEVPVISPTAKLRPDLLPSQEEPAPKRNARGDMIASSVFCGGSGAAIDELSPRRNVRGDKLKSSITFGGPAPGEDQDNALSPTKRPNQYLRSSVFAQDAAPPVSPGRKSFANQYVTKSGIEFGDDGGTTGMPQETPKWVVARTKRHASPTEKRSPGGKSTLQLG